MGSGEPFVVETWAWAIAGCFAFGGLLFSCYNIYKHLSHWTKPVYQLWIVRVLFIIPVYSFISFFSIRFETAGLYMEILRDCYEAFVIYCFLIWILNVIGGEESCGMSIASRMHMPHPIPLCCLPHIRLNSTFLRVCKQFTLQFVILKPIMGTISFILLAIGGVSLYDNDIWQIIMLSIYNVSYTLALYGLFLFYIATRDEMKAHSPVKKFLAVKSIVFMTYWQSLFVPLVFGSTYSDKYDDFILCCEMLVFSYLHYVAFPWWEFKYAEIELTKEIDYGHTGFSSLDDELIKNTRISIENKNNKYNHKHRRKDNQNNNYDGIHKITGKNKNINNKTKNSNKNYAIGSNSSLHNAKTTLMDSIENKNNDNNININDDINDPDLPDDSPEPIENDRKYSDDNQELYALSHHICNGSTFCVALCEVLNVSDVFDDAYYNFKPTKDSSKTNINKNKNKNIVNKQNDTNIDTNIDANMSSYSAMNDIDDNDNTNNKIKQQSKSEMIGTMKSINNNDVGSKGLMKDMVSTMVAHKVIIGSVNTNDIIKQKQASLLGNINDNNDENDVNSGTYDNLNGDGI